jgi:endonuclease/exonuclease/phosphatase family metal-dependent hydrolase
MGERGNKTMRIVSWNCRNGFNKEKANAIFTAFKPDILVIQECKEEDFERLDYPKERADWYGDSVEAGINNKYATKDLGIGIFCKDNYTASRDLTIPVENRYILPFCIKNMNGKSFELFAVWTKPVDGKKNTYENYHKPVFNTLEAKNYKFENSIIIGDFNTGADRSDYKKWYSKLNERMGEADLKNCAGEDVQELCPTFFRGNGSWLDDHCFASSGIKVISFGIGNKDYWRQYSDHCPIIVDFDW